MAEELTEKKTRKGRLGRTYYENELGIVVKAECKECGEVKSVNAFNKHSGNKIGVRYKCKECRHKYEESLRRKQGMKAKVYIELEERHGVIGKPCTKCGEWKPLESGFHKDDDCLGGRTARCKACAAKYSKKYNVENAGRNRDRSRKYYFENHEYCLGYMAERRRKHPDKQREWYAKNREHALNYSKEYVRKNPEKVRDTQSKYREKNRDKIRKYQRYYLRSNPEKVALYRHRRYARKSSLPDDLTAEQQAGTLAAFNGVCALTGDTENLHWDHVIPINSGHCGTTYGNMIPLRADLNSSKHDRNIFEWFDANRERFDLSQTKFDALIEWLAQENEMTVDEYRDYVCWCHANPRELKTPANC